METFSFKLRNNDKEEILEIILYQNEKKGKFKFSKEIKRYKYTINLEDLGEKNVNGTKFVLFLEDYSFENIEFHFYKLSNS